MEFSLALTTTFVHIDVVSKLQRQLKQVKQEMEEELAKKNAKIKSLEKVRITKALCDSFQVLEVCVLYNVSTLCHMHSSCKAKT